MFFHKNSFYRKLLPHEHWKGDRQMESVRERVWEWEWECVCERDRERQRDIERECVREIESMIRYYMIWYDTIWYGMIHYDILWYDTIWSNTIWYYVIPFQMLLIYSCMVRGKIMMIHLWRLSMQVQVSTTIIFSVYLFMICK